MARPLMFLPPLIFAGLAATFWWGMQRQNPDQLPTAFQGKQAPAVRLESLPQGQAFDDADLRDGKIKLVNFWASWCAPCRVEHPQLESLAKEGVTILGVNYKDDPDKAQGFLDDMGNPFARMGADPKGQMALNWGVYGVPETFVVDGDGMVIFRFAGPVTPEVAEDQIEPLLAGDGE